MHKVHDFSQLLPPSILNIINEGAPVPGSTHETSVSWLNENSTKLQRRSITYKGPLFYTDMLPKICSYRNENNAFKTIFSFKTFVKKYLLKLQGSCDPDEWCGENLPLHYVPGLRRSTRNKTWFCSFIINGQCDSCGGFTGWGAWSSVARVDYNPAFRVHYFNLQNKYYSIIGCESST